MKPSMNGCRNLIVPYSTLKDSLGLLGLLCCDHDDRVFPYNGYGNSMSSYLCKKSLCKPKMIILFMDVYKVGFTVGGFGL